MEGFVKLHRRLLDSDVWQNPNALRVFLWALLRANYTQRTVHFGGRDLSLAPGEFISGRFAGSAECHLKPSTFRNAVCWLQDAGMIRTKPDNQKTVFTVVNWARFQIGCSQVDSRRTTGGHRQEGKKDTEAARRANLSPLTFAQVLHKELEGKN